MYSSVHVKRTNLCHVSVCYKGDSMVLCGLHLFVLSCARMRRCALVNGASVVFIVGAAVCVVC